MNHMMRVAAAANGGGGISIEEWNTWVISRNNAGNSVPGPDGGGVTHSYAYGGPAVGSGVLQRVTGSWSEAGTMWGSPQTWATVDSAVNRIVQHIIPSQFWGAFKNAQTVPILIRMSNVGYASTSRIMYNGYASLSYGEYPAHYCVRVWFYDIESKKAYTVNPINISNTVEVFKIT